MAEEVEDASRSVPPMMLLANLASGVTGLVMIITFVFDVRDVKSQIVDSEAVYPFIEVFAQSIGTGTTVGLTVPLAILSFCSSVSSMATASRQAFAFARAGGFLFPEAVASFTNVSGRWVPVKAIVASCLLSIVFAVLNLFGSEIFDSITGLTNIALVGTYILAIGSVLWRRVHEEPLPPALFSPGKVGGVVVNCIALLYLVQFLVFSAFPLFARPSAKTMNWGIVTFLILTVATWLYYILRGCKIYISPRERVMRAEEAETSTVELKSRATAESSKEGVRARGPGGELN